MVNSKGFPAIKLGKKILVVRDKVDEFLYDSIGKTF